MERNAWDDVIERQPDWLADAPYDFVVSFLKRYGHTGDRVYEVGFGSGANLRWANEHGFHVGGIEASAAGWWSAIANIGLHNDSEDALFLQHGLAPAIKATDESYDLIIDRACLSYLSDEDMEATAEELWRIARPGAYLLFNPYGLDHTYAVSPEPKRYSYYGASQVFTPNLWERVEARTQAVTDDTLNEYGQRGVESTLRIVYRKRVEL